VLVGILQAVLILGAGMVLFDVPLEGSLALLAGATLLFITANLAVGYTFSTLARIIRGEAHREPLGGVRVETSLTQEHPSGFGGSRGELLAKVGLGRGVGGEQSAAVALLGGRGPVFVVQLVAEPAREPFDGRHENVTWSIFCRKVKTSPPSPQPKQW